MTQQINQINRPGTWWTWNDRTGEEIGIRVQVIYEFYEPGDNIPGYHCNALEDYDIGYGVRPTGTPIGGLDSQSVTLDRE